MAESTAQIREREQRKTVIGVVTAARRSPKTIRVAVEYLVRHSAYGKILRKKTVLTAHDEKSDAKLGDRVELMECRPISKTKTWRLVKVVESAHESLSEG